MGDITKDFSYHEFNVDKDTAPKWVLTSIKILCRDILQPTRDHFGKPVHITKNGGFRDFENQNRIWTNRLAECGGNVAMARLTVAPPGHSGHEKAQAADTWIEGVPVDELAAWYTTLPTVGGIGIYHNDQFVHVDDRPKTDGVIARW